MSRPSDIAFAAARILGASAADEPAPQRRCDLYMAMLDRDLLGVEWRANEDRPHAVAEGWAR